MDTLIDELSVSNEHRFDHLISVIEASLKVRRRHQLFLWIQGIFQSVLAHESLVCVLGEGRDGVTDHFSVTEGREQFFADFCHPEFGVLRDVIRLWMTSGFRPVLVDTDPAKPNYEMQAANKLRRQSISTLAAHGIYNERGELSSFFCFLNLGPTAFQNAEHSLDIVIPFLSSAYIRAKLESGPVERPPNAFSSKVLTSRQTEILLWVQEGKSNAEIGNILNISALTVKNHVQKILRRLNVQNRAQAVSKGFSLNIMKIS